MCGRNADTLARLQAAEKALKQQQEDAYVDMDKSNEEKELGNADFKAGRCARRLSTPQNPRHLLTASLLLCQCATNPCTGLRHVTATKHI